MSLISSMGIGYCRDWLSQALLIYQDRPAQIGRIEPTDVQILFLDGQSPREVSAPHDYFTGFRVLAYPALGYRRVGNVVYHVHRAQSAYRGLRGNLLTFENTPMSALVCNSEATMRNTHVSGSQRLAAVMCPNYDGRAELEQLVAGSLMGVVPNENICIEPCLSSPNYIVMYRGKIVGHMDPDLVFHIPNTAVRLAVESAFSE